MEPEPKVTKKGLFHFSVGEFQCEAFLTVFELLCIL